MFQLLSGLTRPSRLLSGLALLVCVVAQIPVWTCWPLLGKQRRDDVLAMVAAVAAWSAAIENASDPPGTLRRPAVRGRTGQAQRRAPRTRPPTEPAANGARSSARRAASRSGDRRGDGDAPLR